LARHIFSILTFPYFLNCISLQCLLQLGLPSGNEIQFVMVLINLIMGGEGVAVVVVAVAVTGFPTTDVLKVVNRGVLRPEKVYCSFNTPSVTLGRKGPAEAEAIHCVRSRVCLGPWAARLQVADFTDSHKAKSCYPSLLTS
jgi:hypothetical protein